MTENNNDVIEISSRAILLAKEHHHEIVTLEHVLVALLETEEVQTCFTDLSLDINEVSELMSLFMISGLIPENKNFTEPLQSAAFEFLFLSVIGSARWTPQRDAKTMDVLLHMTGFPHEDSHAISALLKVGLTSLVLKKYMSRHNHNTHNEFDHGMPGGFGGDSEPNSPEKAVEYLAKYSLNLNQLAKAGKIDPLIGRAEEVNQIIQVTARKTKNNSILVGESGVGKSAIVEGLAFKIVQGDVPEILKKSVVYSLDVGSLVAGTRFRGDFEERMKFVLKSLTYLPDAILFIDEMHTIMDAGTGSKGSLDVANLLKPALAKGHLRCIGATTLEEYRKNIEKDKALIRRFKKIIIDEPSPELTKVIIRGLKEIYEKFHHVVYTDEAIDAAVDLTHKYVTNLHLPDKAIDLIDNAGARQRILPDYLKKKEIGVFEIEQEISKIAVVPMKEFSLKETFADNLEENLKKTVFGQDRAIAALVDSVFISKAGLRDIKKPAGCYLFTGSSGTGKTALSKSLAESLNIPLIRFDMSEYQEKHAVSKFIGSPPGYVGYGEGGAGSGLLTNAIDTNPNCVLLLDEIEKAHEDIYNILLQVMDDASLTNAAGKTINFRNVILIMTSNAGISSIEKNPLGFSNAEVEDVDDKVIQNLFRPEFRNRLDEIVKFDRLKPEHMLHIVDKFINELELLASEKNVKIHITDEARNWLAKEGYNPSMGARPLTRVISTHVKKPLSRIMLTGVLKDGGIAIIQMKDGKLVIE